MTKKIFKYGADSMSAGDAFNICHAVKKGVITQDVSQRILDNRKHIEKVVKNGETVYGVTTGFGPLVHKYISPEKAKELQYNLLVSHSAGIGKALPRETSKLMLVLKLHALAKGYSGMHLRTLDRIGWHIENNIIPVVPEQGSVGASGDLAPLAHLFLPLIGKGYVHYKGKIVGSDQMLRKEGLKPIELDAKEGLGLINGTQFMTAIGIQILQKLSLYLDQADIIAAMMLEAMTGSERPFLPKINKLRPFKGNLYVSERMRHLLKGSEILRSHQDCQKVQDPYSLRCIAQVHGASRNAFLHFKEMLFTEINAVTDNPLIFDDGEIISGGNFHGQPIALPLDYIGLASSEMGNISDRRIYLSLDNQFSDLPKLLIEEDVGLNSGFMIIQYTSAALVSENKALCFPASSDSIPTGLGQEDHVSMGSISARKSLRIVENVGKILGLEMLCAAQGLDFRRPLKSSGILDRCHEMIRTRITHRIKDDIFKDDIDAAVEIVEKGELSKTSFEYAQTNSIPLLNETHEIFGIH